MTTLIIVYSIIYIFIGYNIFRFIRTYHRLNPTEQKIYVSLIIVLIGWVSTNAVTDLVKDHEIAKTAASLAILFPPVIMLGIYLTANYFPQVIKKSDTLNQIFSKFFIFSTIITISVCIVLLKTPYNIQEFEVRNDNAAYFVPGVQYYYVILFTLSLLVATTIRWHRKRNFYTHLQNSQVKILRNILYFIVITNVLGYAVLPLLGLTQLTPITFTSVILYLYVLQQNFLSKNTSINLARISKNLLIFLTLVAISSSLIILFFIAYEVDTNPLIPIVGSGLLVLLIKQIRATLNKSLYHSNPEVITLKCIKSISTSLDLQFILDHVEETVKEITGLKTISLVLDNDPRLTNKLNNKDKQVFKVFRRLWKKVSHLSIITPEILLDKYFKHTILGAEIKIGYELMRDHDIEVAIPIGKNESIQGVILVFRVNQAIDASIYKYLKLL